MKIVDVAAAPTRRAPFAGGPTARPLLGPDSGAPVAVLHITLPAGGRLPEHDHGPSHVVLIALQGHVRLHHDGNDHDLSAGTVTHIAVGELVGLANPGPDPAELVVVASPPDFAATLSTWPTA